MSGPATAGQLLAAALFACSTSLPALSRAVSMWYCHSRDQPNQGLPIMIHSLNKLIIYEPTRFILSFNNVLFSIDSLRLIILYSVVYIFNYVFDSSSFSVAWKGELLADRSTTASTSVACPRVLFVPNTHLPPFTIWGSTVRIPGLPRYRMVQNLSTPP